MMTTPPDTGNTTGTDSDKDAALVAAFQDQISTIKTATQQVEAGGMPDMTALEAEVDKLCGKATECAPESRGNLRALMAIMIDHLETLARRIKETHDIDSTPS